MSRAWGDTMPTVRAAAAAYAQAKTQQAADEEFARCMAVLADLAAAPSATPQGPAPPE